MSITPSPDIPALLNRALREYEKKAGINLEEYPLTVKLSGCNNAESIILVLEEQAQEFQKFRGSGRKGMDWLKPTVHILYTLSGVLGDGICPFSPAKAIFSGIGVLLSAIKDVSASYDALVDLFESTENFLRRLDIYTKTSLTEAMTVIVVKIMVELLSTLALATQHVKQGRLKKFGKKLLGEKDIEAVLQRLDRLTHEEARTTAVQTMDIVYGLFKSMTMVIDDGKASMDDIRRTLVTLQGMVVNMNSSKRDRLQQNVRNWLSPPDPSKNQNITRRAHHAGTATWFIEGNTFAKWKGTGSLLWIHGKPGSGKSVLCSTIIQDIKTMQEAGLASLAYFYFDFRDITKQTTRGLLSSLLIQLSARSDLCSDVLSSLYSKHDQGLQQPSDDVLFECLKDMLLLTGQGPMYIVVDALDESPNNSGTPSPRERLLKLFGAFIGLDNPHLHICITSRPEPDIRKVLRPLSSFSLSIHDENGQIQDIVDYINSVVASDFKMRKWTTADKQVVIDMLTQRADGMFRWVYCQLDKLRRCLPGRIRHALDELPGTLDGTYERALQDIDEENWAYAYRLFQCVAVASRPLRVEELAELLAFDFGGTLPTFRVGWRPEDPRDAVLSTGSSLLAVVDVHGSQVVQFSHFSVKEFLTSDRLFNAEERVSRYYISLERAHVMATQACLGTLTQLSNVVNQNNLTKYAAEHWVDHARFGNVSSQTRDAIKCLFDPNEPHFSTWVSIWDIDEALFPSGNSFNRTPLYYAARCGFHDVAEWLVIEHLQDVNVRGGVYGAPLHAASAQGYLDAAQVLLKHGADVKALGEDGQTPLHLASVGRHLDIMSLLFKNGADPNARDNQNQTPLHIASDIGHSKMGQLLLRHGGEVNIQCDDDQTPLHRASTLGHLQVVRLLLQHNADVHLQDTYGDTPLLLASAHGHLEIARLLLNFRADPDDENKYIGTSLHQASLHGHLGIVELLLQYGADADALDYLGRVPLHSASEQGHMAVVRLLEEHAEDQESGSNPGTLFRRTHEIAELLS